MPRASKRKSTTATQGAATSEPTAAPIVADLVATEGTEAEDPLSAASGTKKAGAGRHSIFTPELGQKIVKLIEAGNYVETAAAAVGVSKDTFYRWLKKGARQARNGKQTDLSAWSERMQHAAARSEAADVLRISAAAKRHWQAAAWRLERKSPERWGRRRVEVTGPAGGPIQTKSTIDLSKATDEQLRILAELGSTAPSSKP